MIGLDTNVLVRYLTQDDPGEARTASQLLESLDADNRGFVSVVVLVELHWVLRRAYHVTREDAALVITTMLDARELALQESGAVRRALRHVDRNRDFADALISELGLLAGCTHTATLDRITARIPGMRLLASSNSGPGAEPPARSEANPRSDG